MIKKPKGLHFSLEEPAGEGGLGKRERREEDGERERKYAEKKSLYG